MHTPSPPQRIPYGVADYIKVRNGNEYYVDKTHYLPLLESAGRFLFLIRPRRFGKSLLQSVMECYYDAHWAERFDELFADTWIHAHPTAEKGQYLTLRLDFSMVDPHLGDDLEDAFQTHLRLRIDHLLNQHSSRIPESEIQRINASDDALKRLQTLLAVTARLGWPLYLFIDEYDHFTNNLLVYQGAAAYRALTQGHGFFRAFFALLKGAAGQSGSGLERLFITGVSPITLDDVTSGFNIATNISLEARFNGLLGFNHSELQSLFAAFDQDFSAHQSIVEEWYNHYYFNEERLEPIVNSDMALYYLQSLVHQGKAPRDLIDHNVRIDYGKLRHLVQVDQQLADQQRLTQAQRLNGNFSRLREIIATGEQVAQVHTSFPAEGLLQQDNFVSLLYYLGLLSFAGEHEGRPLLKIPNRTVWQLMYSYLREGYQQAGVFAPSTYEVADRLNHMAYRGEWMGFFDYLAEQIAQQASVRDFLHGEKMIQGFLLAWLNFTPYFRVFSEAEQAGGFVDLYLAPFYFKFPDMRHAYLIELKYMSRDKDTPQQREKLLNDARTQLRRYAGDARVQSHLGEAQVQAIVLLYSGWELVVREAVAV